MFQLICTYCSGAKTTFFSKSFRLTPNLPHFHFKPNTKAVVMICAVCSFTKGYVVDMYQYEVATPRNLQM